MYIIKKSKKRKKTIEIRVVNNQIVIYVPQKTTNAEIEQLYNKYSKNLLNKIDFNKNIDYMYFLGKQYNVVVKENELLKIAVCEIKEDNFVVFKPKKIEINLEDVIKKWQLTQIKKIIPERVRFFMKNYNFNFSFEKNSIRFKNQKTKWGSCSYCNNLNFNYKVVEKSEDIIDYLVVHELSHTIHKNHSQNFWKYVETILPNYKELRKKLKN